MLPTMSLLSALQHFDTPGSEARFLKLVKEVEEKLKIDLSAQVIIENFNKIISVEKDQLREFKEFSADYFMRNVREGGPSRVLKNEYRTLACWCNAEDYGVQLHRAFKSFAEGKGIAALDEISRAPTLREAQLCDKVELNLVLGVIHARGGLLTSDIFSGLTDQSFAEQIAQDVEKAKNYLTVIVKENKPIKVLSNLGHLFETLSFDSNDSDAHRSVMRLKDEILSKKLIIVKKS